jgi:hypothetical protein
MCKQARCGGNKGVENTPALVSILSRGKGEKGGKGGKEGMNREGRLTRYMGTFFWE